MSDQIVGCKSEISADFRPCIVIPVYNHENAIGIFVQQLLVNQIPIILVNDGSSDECRLVLESLNERYDQVVLINLPENVGKGGAVKQGFVSAYQQGFSHALQVDADGQHSANDVQRFVDECQNNPQAIIAGHPIFDESVPAHRFYARYLTHIWVCINTLSFEIKDSMCGFRFYPLKEICELLAKATIGNRMDFDSEILVHWLWKGNKIVNLPTKVSYPIDGVSHFNLWRDNVLITRMHTRLFFGMLVRMPKILYRRVLNNG